MVDKFTQRISEVYRDIRPDDPLREMKERTNRESLEAVLAARKWAEDNPVEHEKWQAEIEQRIIDGKIEGFLDGLWDLDDNGEMAPFPIVIDSATLPENALMAHVLAKAGIFPSVGQARKNGWDRPLEKGLIVVTKRKIRIKVI